MKEFDAVIIGAGVAGLTVAYELSKHYSDILVIEKGSEVGGTVSSYNIDGFNIESYYHHFFSQDLALLNLSKELGLEDSQIWHEAPTGYYFDNRIFNLNTPIEILNCKFMSLSDKFKLGLALLKLRHREDLSSLDAITAKEWIIENTSRRVYENFFKPLLRSKFGNEPNISAAWLCARIKKRSNKNFKGEKLGYFKGGFRLFFETIMDKAGTKLNMLKDTKAERIIIEENMVRGVFAGGNEYLADKVISTVGAGTLLGLCDLPYSLKEKLRQIKEQCIVCCLFGLKHSLMTPYWLNIKSEDLPFGILIEHNNFVNLEEYRNTRLLYAITYCEDENNALFKMQDREIIDIYLRALESQFSLRRDDVLWWRISKTTEAGPVYRKNFLKLIPEIDTGINGLYLSGMIRSYPDRGINESIKDAQECADVILKKHSK